jgi:mono/diheme cytochrome c family protein
MFCSKTFRSVGALGAAAMAYGMIAIWSSAALHAGQSRTANQGVYGDAQAGRGQAMFKERCATCHGDSLEGDLAPPLTGPEFLGAWGNQPLSELVTKIEKTMPASDPGTTTRQQAADLVAHILAVGKFPAGTADLASDEATLRNILLPGPAPKPAAATAAAPNVAQARPAAATGNMAQLMRGLLFPTSNLIFNVQNQDPGGQRVGWEPGKTAFSWADWGAGIYSGWEMVDNAAITISEAAPLLLTSRRCENGKPAPVDRADWATFTEGLAEAGRAAFKASQTRNRDAVVESTNQLADACLACHQTYRDKPGGTPADPSNKAARCTTK